MDMEKINEKLNSFTETVLKEASKKADALLSDTREERKGKLEEQEIVFLKGAYRKIHEALAEVEKESNSLYSSKLFEAKKILYNKRNEITDRVFNDVMKKLQEYRKTNKYSEKLRQFIEKGLSEVGDGKIRITVDAEDLELARKIAGMTKKRIEISESRDKLYGGCIVMNDTNGLLADYSFRSRLENQRKVFLELSGLNVDL